MDNQQLKNHLALFAESDHEAKLALRKVIDEELSARLKTILDVLLSLPDGFYNEPFGQVFASGLFNGARKYKEFLQKIKSLDEKGLNTGMFKLTGHLRFVTYSTSHLWFSYVKGFDEEVPDEEFIIIPLDWFLIDDEVKLELTIKTEADIAMAASIEWLKVGLAKEERRRMLFKRNSFAFAT